MAEREYTIVGPGGKELTIVGPDNATPQQLRSAAEKAFSAIGNRPSAQVSDNPLVALGAGLGKGVGTVALNAQKLVGKGVNLAGDNSVGNWLVSDAERGLQNLQQQIAPYKQASPISAGAGEIGGEIVATLPVGLGISKAVGSAAGSISPQVAAKLAPLAEAIRTGGMRTGAAPGALNMATRMAGGAITGGAAAGLVTPEDSGTGAMIGAALPPAISVAGKMGSAIGNVIRGPQASAALQESAKRALDAGYVIPPSQVRPSLANRLLEGFSGKLTTAQNASARNQQVTNELARKAIAAPELSAQGLSEVRAIANQAYDNLAQVGSFEADDAYRNALQKAAGSKALPGIVNREVDDLVQALSSQGSLDANQTIESIKRLRFEGSANRVSQDPTKKALGKAQLGISNALEDLIDRNLANTGNQDLLKGYRSARQTLAKTYDIERALNQSSGNVDANKLAQLLKKGRPLTGELRTIAEFSSTFPKAAQTVEKMGSLPQVSPLDFGALGAISAATSNPLLMAGVLARPAARKAVLSAPVQNRLLQVASQGRPGLLSRVPIEQATYRAAPILSAQ